MTNFIRSVHCLHGTKVLLPSHLQILDHNMEWDLVILKEFLDSIQTGIWHMDVNWKVTGTRMSPEVQLEDNSLFWISVQFLRDYCSMSGDFTENSDRVNNHKTHAGF